MQREDSLLYRNVIRVLDLDEQKHFLRRLDLALPAIGAFDRQLLHTGGKPFADQRLGDLARGRDAARRQDDGIIIRLRRHE